MIRLSIAAGLVALSCLALPAAAAETESAAPAVEPEALSILQRAAQHLAGASHVRLRMRTLYDVVQDSGQKLQFGTWDEVTIRRPDRAAATFRRDDGRVRRLWYDGSKLTLYDTTENVYGQLPVPETLDEMLDFVEIEVGAPLPLADLFYSDLSHLAEAALEGSYVGPSLVEEHECDHLAFRGEVVDWQMWVDRETPVFRKVVITYKELPGTPQFGALFTEWDFSPQVSDADFAFKRPDGAELISTLARPGSPRIQGPR
jgi:hypothetical protein